MLTKIEKKNVQDNYTSKKNIKTIKYCKQYKTEYTQ